MLLGGALCDSLLDLVILVDDKLESVFGSPNCAVNKNSCLWLWSIFEQ